MKNVPTPHITAGIEDFGQTVLMPGDPLRSQYIAQRFLEDAKLVNNVRGVQGYTGYYKGKKVSVMASGMGMPAIGIYAHELFNFYDIQTIIRVGSAGALVKDINVGDIVLGSQSFYRSTFIQEYIGENIPAIPDKGLLQEAEKIAKEMNLKYKVAPLFSSDVFYGTRGNDEFVAMGAVAVEMESAALYAVAEKAKKKALTICTISDSLVTGEALSAEERQTSFEDMMKLSLELA